MYKIFVILSTIILPAKYTNAQQPDFFRNAFLFKNDRKNITSLANLPESVTLFTPVYSNIEQFDSTVKIFYSVSYIDKFKLLDTFKLGTIYITDKPVSFDTIATVNIMNNDCCEIMQLVKTEHDDYLGYLEELINVPFILPPRHLSGYGHQTDHRIAVDCAELAIYGKRRQGYNIPYCGPLRIVRYLQKIDSISSGAIIHYGFQVSVVYQDRGIPGILDDEDLLIHAYENKAEIVTLGKTNLKNKKYIPYIWKNDLPRFQ